MTQVEFDTYPFRISEQDGKKYIYDFVRKKEVQLTPEEWVRQHILHYLVQTLHYPTSLIAVERGIDVNGQKRRFDIVVFNRQGKAHLLVECKAPGQPVNRDVLMQMAAYNLPLQANYFWLSNGADNYCCQMLLPLTVLNRATDIAPL